MSHKSMIGLVSLCVMAAQTATALATMWTPVWFHVPSTARLVGMVALFSGMSGFSMKYNKNLPQSECLCLVLVLAGGAANLLDILCWGAVLDYIPIPPTNPPVLIGSPGDLLLMAGVVGFAPLCILHARRNVGVFGLYRQLREHLRDILIQQFQQLRRRES